MGRLKFTPKTAPSLRRSPPPSNTPSFDRPHSPSQTDGWWWGRIHSVALPQYTIRTDRPTNRHKTDRWASRHVSKISRLRLIVNDAANNNCHWTFLKSELQYSNPFWNAKATNEGESADYAKFDPKLVAIATSLKQSGKGVRLVILNQISTIWCKVGENRSSSSWDSFAQMFI